MEGNDHTDDQAVGRYVHNESPDQDQSELAGGQTPAQIADGGITPATIQARAGASAMAGDPAVEGEPTRAASAKRAQGSEAEESKERDGQEGPTRAALRSSRGSVHKNHEDSQVADNMLSGQGSGNINAGTRTQRKLVPIRGSGHKRSSREGVHTESRTLDNEEWESAAHLRAQGRAGQDGGMVQPRVNGVGGGNAGQPGDMKGTGGFPGQDRAHGRGSKQGHRSRPVRADHGQGLGGNTHDSRSASGTGQRGEVRGPRAIHYNEDGSTNLNQSYVDKVLAMAQHNAPGATKQQLYQQISGHPTSSGNQSRAQDASGDYDPSQAVAVAGRFGARHQSVDVAAQRASRNHPAHTVGAHRPSHDQSHLSGASLAAASPLIEEVRKNNFVQVSRLMDQFIVGKQDSGTVTGRETQQRKRRIQNSFQTGLGRKRGSAAGGSSTKPTEHPDYPGAVGPKSQINVPKQLILYQLSKNMDAAAVEQSIAASAQRAAGYGGLPPETSKSSGLDRSFLDFLEGSVAAPESRAFEQFDPHRAHRQQQSVQNNLAKQSPFAAKSLRTIDPNPNSVLEALQGANHRAMANVSSNLFENSHPSMPQSLDASPSLPSFTQGGPGQGTPSLTNFHITDLLERSIIVGAKEREQNKLRQIVEFYKRAVKDDRAISSKKEVMIRNYRLHVVKDVAAEIDEDTRALFTLNKGTCIHVSNSIIKPEIHKFGTKVSDVLGQVYPQLLEDERLSPRSPLVAAKERHFQRRAQSVATAVSGMSGQIFAKPDERAVQELMQLQEEEAQMLRQEMESQRTDDQHLEALQEERSQQSQGSRGPRARLVDGEGVDLSPEKDHTMAEMDEATSSRPFTAVDAEEMEAITQTNKIFDRWLRNVVSQKSAALESPRRARRIDGEPVAPGIRDINWQIAVAGGGILKERPVPLELLTQRSFYDATPYRYLQMLVVNQDIREWFSKFVLKAPTARSYHEIVTEDQAPLNFADSKIAIDFSRHHLTHLDPVVFPDDTLPAELFLDYDVWIREFAKAVRDMQADNELVEGGQTPGLEAFTDYFMKDGARKAIPVRVQDFDPGKARFLVQNKEMDIETWRSRLYIRLPEDKREDLEAHKVEVMKRKAETLHYLRLHRLICGEMTKRYSYLRLSNEVLAKIHARISIDLSRYSPDSVRKVILQIEALYVFAILKATLSSQKLDPFIKGLLRKYKIPLNTPALTYFNPEHKEKRHLQGIEDYNMKGIKVELDHNSMMLMDEKYIKMPIFLNALTERTIGAHRLFRFPFEINLLLAQSGKEFKKMKKEDLDAQVNTFPLHHDKFVQAQGIMSKYFHQIAKFRWAESIQQEVWGFVKDDFDFDQGKELVEDQIDPVLLRLFYQLKLYMQTVIFDHFESALRDYMRFLLSFILRDPEIRETGKKILDDVQTNPWIRLSLKENRKMQFKKGEIVNDLDLIPLRNKPMILIATQIDDVPGKLPSQKKQKVVTRPDLDTVHKDLFQIILNMHESLQQIDRIDAIVFPLLQLEDPYLLVPDVQSNEKLSHYVQVINKLIEQCLKPTKKELHTIGTYMTIFDKRVDNIILDLKKRSFELQQDLSDGDGGGEKEGSGEDEAPKAADEQRGDEESDEEDDDSYEEEEDEDGEEGYAGNDRAFQSVEIDDGLMKDELFALRDLVWKVLENVHDQYDFGMVYLDCVKFKDRILSHIRELVAHLEAHIRSDFSAKQRTIQQEIVGVEGKLDMEVESIDHVIMLLDYIDSLKKQDNKIGDISLLIDELAKRMDYIEGVKILFPDEQYSGFLTMRNWPRTFKQYIEERRQQLLAKREELYQEMSEEIEEVFQEIRGFKDTIKAVLKKGLDKAELEYDAEEPDADSMASGEGPPPLSAEEQAAKAAEAQRQLESAEGKTFPWIALEIKMDDKEFKPGDIEQVYHDIEALKSAFDEVERRTALINKRETLLGVSKTQFSELRVIQDDLKPLFELWLVASRFSRTLPGWVEGKFDQLDAGLIETKIDEWINELKRLQKTNLVAVNAKQQELLKFMFESLTHFKRYGPMLRTLRTKGLAQRHWRTIGQKLGFQIDPQSITLYRLIKLELDAEDKLKTIKQICEIATKEYAVQLALETLDKEMRAVEFDFQLQTDGETIVITRLPDLITMFEEFFLRASVLKTNPHIRSFFERLLEIEKIIKNVVELINEWAVFQRNFIYLNGIFVLDEIAKSLPQESKFFAQVQILYSSTTQSFQATEAEPQRAQVWRLNQRENFLTTLMKNNQECEIIRNGLMDFLESKRGKFPRLFFLSNEELIEIFGKGLELVESMIEGGSQGFVTNLFEGVDTLRFHEITYEVTHMLSKDGEELHLVKEVGTRNTTVDSWLKLFESSMVLTVKEALFLTFEQMGLQDAEAWVSEWPGQATFLSSQIWFTMRVEAIFAGSADRERALRYAGGGAAPEKEGSDEDEDDPSGQLPVTGSGAGEGDGDASEEERAYLEEVNRQIAKDEVNAPEQAQLEKILRLKQRFRINKTKTAAEQMEKMYQEIANTIMLFTGMVRKKLKGNVRAATVALLTGYVHFRDILNGLVRDRVYKADEFKWQMQFKFDMKNMLEVVARSATDTGSKRKLETKQVEVDCEVFGNVRSYGFEYLGNCQRLVVTPLTERCQRSLLVALQYHYGGAPEGPFGTGKTETTKDLSRLVAKLCFVLNSSANYEYAGVCRFFKGLASSGAWVCFDEFNRMGTQILSLISQVIISIQGAIKHQASHLQLDEAKIQLRGDCAIFITLNPGYAGRSELPMNLKTLFRPISMVVPDSVFITEILLYSSGFVGAQQLAKKIVSVQALANVIMNKAEIAHDFGLRSIKAIVGIAENLKLHAQNIADSDLTEVIDDYTLSEVPYKTDQVIKEVMAASQARITKATELAKLAGASSGKGGKSGKGRAKGQSGGFSAGGEELVQVDEAAEADLESNASPTLRGGQLGGTTKDISKRQGLREIDEQVQGKEGDGGGFRDSMQSLPEEGQGGPEGKKGGELYRRLWGRAKFPERQLRTVYKQIGIDPEQHYDEEELEEYIILKAVRDYNHSKFATEEHVIIEGIIKDIFQGAVPDLDKPVQDYGNLKEAIHQSFEVCKIDFSASLRTKALQMYEIQRSKHGCILVGEPQSGKSTLIYLLQSALNKAALNEFMLAVSETRRARLVELAKEHESQVVETTLQKTQNSGKPGMGSSENMMAAGRKKPKKNDKDAQAKKLLAQWQDMYKQTKLTEEEIEEIRASLTIKGVSLRRVNPKGMTIDELFGTFDKESHEWHEGLFTQHYRDFAGMRNDKKKWILLDGPIDFMWVENLNSILDDNKKMSLPNGESIKMSEGTCILLETNNMRNVTPATVSRCGLIFLHRRETCNPKAIFNQWLRKLPPNLAEYAKDLDAAANYLMVECIAVYEEERKAGTIGYQAVDLHWLMQNFVRLLSTLIFDFHLEYEKSNAMAAATANPNELGKSLQNMTLGNAWVDLAPDPNMTIYPESEAPASAQQQSRQGSQHSQHRVPTPDARQRELEKKKRLPRCNFLDSEIRFENALKFTAIWLEAFIVFSMVWTFYPVLSDASRKRLDQKLQAKYAAARTDYAVYQKEKKKKMAEKNREKSQSNKQSIDKGKSVGRASAILSKKSVQSEKSSVVSGSQAQPTKERDSQPNHDGFSPFWSDDLEERPMLISDYPEDASFYDYYFNLESSGWNKFSLEMEMNDAQIAFSNVVPSQKKIQNFYVPSADSVRYSYLLECLVTSQVSTLVVGPAGSGRSALLRETLFGQVFNYTKQLITDHVTMSAHTDSQVFKENIERLLEWRPNKATGLRRLRPHLDNKLICYVEDLHMSWTDSCGDQPAVEAVRDYLTQRAWLSSRKRRLREIEDVSFFACLASNAPETSKVSGRVLHQFNLIALDEPKAETMKAMFSTLTNMLVLDWPSAIQPYATSIVNAVVDVSLRVFAHLKPTPMKAHYTFTWRDVDKILLALQKIEANSLKKQANVMKLLYHECYRNYGDRLLMVHDRAWFTAALEEVCRQHFYVVDRLDAPEVLAAAKNQDGKGAEKGEGGAGGDDGAAEEAAPGRKDPFLWPISDPEQLYYSAWNHEVDGFYMEVDPVDTVQKVIEGHLERYNDSNERVRLDLMLFNQVNRLMLKILRVISSPGGHLINVAMKGHGMNSIMKLVTFAAGHQHRELEVYEGFQTEDWHGELRRAVVYCATEDKPLTLFLDEYKMLNDQMYLDLECLIKNNVVSDIVRKPDVMLVLANVYEQLENEKKAAKFGLDGAEADDGLTQAQQEENGRQREEQQTEFIADNKRMMLKWPHIQAELYQVFLNRVRANFHLVLQYTPTGGNFREKIASHKQLLYLSQMTFFADLPAQELEALGRGFFKLEHEKAENKAIIENREVKTNQYSMSNDKDSQDRVLTSIVKMYLQAQEMTKKFAEDQGQVLYMTPAMFLRVFNCYKKLLKERHVVVKDISSRYEAGLEKIRQTQDAIYRYHQELERKSPILQEKQASLARVIKDIEDEFQGIKTQRDQLKRDEFEAEGQAEQALRIKEQCEDTLNKIIPSLNEAMNSVTSLSKYDLAELRSMKKPPKVVKLVLQTVCMLLGVPPAEKKSKKTGKLKLSYWKAAQGKEVLGNPQLPALLVDFDRNKLTPEIMMEVEDVLTRGNYSYEKAHTASVAATGIFKWVKATRDYFYIFKDIEPRRDAFMLSQKQYEEKKKQLEEKTAKIDHLDAALQGLKEHQSSKDGVIDELRTEIQDCAIRKKRADILLKGLSAEKQKWIVCTRMLSSKYTTVTGDVLLSAGYITLVGGFNQRYRNKLIQRWAKTLTEEGFQCSKEFVFTELFGDSYKIRKWHQNQLPSDSMSVNNALVVEKTKRFCLLVDPQVQGITWLKNQFDDGGTLTVVKQNDSQFKKLIEIAIDMGRTVVVENVGEEIGMNLQSLMKKQVSKYGGQRMVLFCRKSYKYDKNFRLFVVSAHPRPHFDVNITNHVTLLNFSVNIESLQAQMLGLVVLNERKDLEDTHNENSKEAFDSIKSLKDIEGTILSQLEMKASELLGDDNLIRALNESKNTAEYVAAKLKNIAQTNQFISRSRDVYAPVAYRAAILYFVVQDLQRVNSMYQFSLSWFKQIFTKSLELTNVARDDPGKLEESDDEAGNTEQSLKLLNNTFSIDERIELLMRTFTQELFKKIQMAVFEEDRKLITYMLVTRVMESESFIDRNLFDFLISGARSVSAATQVPEELDRLPWLNSMVWADLKYLSTLKPFNATNLLGHITRQQESWNNFFGKRDRPLTFEDLPNKEQLDLRYFTQLDQDELFEETGQLLPDGRPAPDTQSQQHLKGTDMASMAGRTAGDTNSRMGSRGHMKRTESEILNDPDIWNLSDSDDEFGEQGKYADRNSEEEGKSAANSDEEAAAKEEDFAADEQEMARYLVEQAPAFGGVRNPRSNINSLRRKTAGERSLILKREKAVKGLSELCILRCIRPDHLIESMERFVLNVLDPLYFDFKENILVPLLRGSKKANPSSKASLSAAELSKKVISKMSASRMSGTNESQNGANGLNANATAGSRMGAMNETKQSMSGTQQSNSTAKRGADAGDGAGQRRGGLNNMKNLLKEAYEDSSCRSPIFFLITHSVNILDMVTEFHQKRMSGGGASKLQYFSLGKGLEEMVEEKMAKAAQNGDWIILENLHLVEDWLPVFEEKMSKWKGSELNTKFRMWITCVPVDNFPASILEKSIKVALQPPGTIKEKMERMLLEQEKESFFRKSGRLASYHKNLFFGLAYFHANLEGRKKYGTLGWHVPYKFDFSDFEVSNAQLTQVMKHNSGDLLAALDMLKYFYANINYAGKLQRVEDQVTVNAILADLFNEKVSFAAELPADHDASHYGFPADNADFLGFLDRSVPVRDPYQVFGFNWNVESSLLKKQMFTILDQIYSLYQGRPGGGEEAAVDNQNTSIEMNSLKTSLRSSHSDSGGQIDRMLKDQDSLLNLFIALQKLLNASSLDKTVTHGGKRYDHATDQEILPQRDLNDKKVAQLAQVLLLQLDAQFDPDVIQKKFPIRYKAPLNNVINRELSSFSRLLTAIRESVADLLANIDGQYPRPLEIEALWGRIQQNKIPEKWRRVSFQTAYDSLADYIVELGLKLDFWRMIVASDGKAIPSYWLPAFFDPRSFLTALMQARARYEEIPMKDLRNDYEVLESASVSEPCKEKHAVHLHGLALEGADWNWERKLVVETTKSTRFVAFPVVKVRTVHLGKASAATPLESSQGPNAKKKKKKQPAGDQGTGAEAVPGVQKFRCPVYRTTSRLSTGLVAADNAPVEYLRLNTLERPETWAKRAVALLLETDRADE